MGDLFPKSARPDHFNNIKIWAFDFLFTLGQFKDTIDKYANIDSYLNGHWGIFTAKQQQNLGTNHIYHLIHRIWTSLFLSTKIRRQQRQTQ